MLKVQWNLISTNLKKLTGKIIAARMGSPLVLGVGDCEFLIDAMLPPIIEHTQQFI